MTYPEIPHDYERLRAALDNDVYPAERHYLDYKLTLYPPTGQDGTRFKGKSKDRIHDELARDMASFGARGGHLIYGVRENKDEHRFSPEEMDLPAHIELAVVDVARTRIRPKLDVVPHVLGRPGQGNRGFLVIEIPESSGAPHQVNGTYYGRSEAGRVVLTDAEVEEQILRRGRMAARLQDAMDETRDFTYSLAANTEPISHMMLTAMPTQPLPEMFLSYTQDKAAQQYFMTNILMGALKAVLELGEYRDNITVAFDHLLYTGRSARTASAWFADWDANQGAGDDGQRWLGVGDDGIIRYVNLDASSMGNGSRRAMAAIGSINDRRGGPILYHENIALYTLDLIRLIGSLATRSNYIGGWLIGLEVDRLRGLTGNRGRNTLDSESYRHEIRTATTDLAEHPRRCVNDLLRPLFRDLGLEGILRQDDQ